MDNEEKVKKMVNCNLRYCPYLHPHCLERMNREKQNTVQRTYGLKEGEDEIDLPISNHKSNYATYHNYIMGHTTRSKTKFNKHKEEL